MQSPYYLCAYYREYFATQGFPALSMGETFAVCKHIYFGDKIKLILYPQFINSIIHLTISYSNKFKPRRKKRLLIDLNHKP